ncbi:MAG: thioredoxin domain-containing protein [Caulobacterales bacterium]
MGQVVCGHCEAINRVVENRPAGDARCGRCHAPLFAGKPIEVSGAGLERRRAQGQGAALLVDVWAPWCGPCRSMAPHFAAAAGRLEPDVQLLKLNSEAEPAAAGALGIQAIPTLILFSLGREVARASGLMTTEQIVQWVRRALGVSAAA